MCDKDDDCGNYSQAVYDARGEMVPAEDKEEDEKEERLEDSLTEYQIQQLIKDGLNPKDSCDSCQ